MYISRQSSHIKEDIARNWSSWNFGEDGIEATEEEMQSYIDEGEGLYISGFEFTAEKAEELWESGEIRELYAGYWVLVDTREGEGLFGTELSADNLNAAIEESKAADHSGEGTCFCAENAKLVWSSECGQFHVFEVEAV